MREDKKILVMNGPNLNLLGEREPGIYGSESLGQINAEIAERALALGFACDFYQSNHEGDLIDKLHHARGEYNAIILNAGAYTHYSYAIRDAIAAIRVPVVEVHLSNIHARDSFRSQSVLAPACMGQICGFGKASYFAALTAVAEIIKD